MEDIRIYQFYSDASVPPKLLHIEHDIISSNWTVQYNAVGTFEAHFSLNSDIVPVIMQNEYLIAVQGDKQAILTGKQVSSDFAVFGKTLNWLLTRRTTAKFLQRTGSPEELAKQIAQEAFYPADNERAFERVTNFEYLISASSGMTIDFWRNTQNETEKVVSECLDRANLGHRITLDIKRNKWVFEIIQGSALPLIISDSNRNAYNSEFTEDLQDYYTCGWFEADAPKSETQSDSSGTTEETPSTTEDTSSTIWTFLPGDDPKSGIYCWEGVLSGRSESEAVSDLAKKSAIDQKIQANTRGLVLGKDYQLGDLVKFQFSAGSYLVTAEKRITGVNIWYENNNIGEQPVFT